MVAKKQKSIYIFSSQSLPILAEVGGKAQSLITMTQEKFPVPNGLVLAVDFFEPWLDEVKNSREWQAFLRRSPKEIKQHCDAVKKFCQTLKLIDKQKIELQGAMKSFDDDNIFAVRSSSPEEDLDGTSFAGGYETTLGVTQETLEKAILHSFISAFDERIVRYKMQHGIKKDDPQIAVIIQIQIASETSGVAFSLNPLNNCYDEVVINANFGLGETVVSGQVTPDTFVVDKVKSKIIEKKIAEKSIALWLTKDGGTKEKNNAQPKKATLSDEQIIEVTKLVEDVEKYFEKPMDIEWAIAGGTLHLLQARPITGYLPLFPEMLTKPGEKKKIYIDIIVLTQGFSESMSVLGLDFWANMLTVAKGPIMIRDKEGIVWDIHGRQYMLASNILKLGGFITKVFESYDGPTKQLFEELDPTEYVPDKKPANLKGYNWGVIKYSLPTAIATIKGLFNGEKSLQAYRELDAKIWKELHEELACSNESFDKQAEQALSAFSMVMDAIGGIGASLYTKWRLSKMFQKYREADDYLVGLSMDLPGNPTSEMGHLMFRIASFPEFQQTKGSAAFLKKLKNGEYSQEFINIYNDYVFRFGCRGVREIDIATPRTSENCEQIFFQLKNINIHDNAILEVKKRSQESYQKLRELAKKIGKEKKFVKLTKTFRNMMGYREHPKYILIVAIDILRKRALKLGEQFVKEGRLEKKEQIFDLEVDQVAKAERDKKYFLKPLIEENTAPYKTVAHVKDWPRVIDSRGKIHRIKRESKEGELVGDAIAPGLVRGKAKVLHSPYEKPLAKGEILVCKASEPSWTPVFINAAGVVMEIGGPLQHGGIIAREYGLPCVSSIDGATTRIKDGDMLEVDGSNGIVKIIDEANGLL